MFFLGPEARCSDKSCIFKTKAQFQRVYILNSTKIFKNSLKINSLETRPKSVSHITLDGLYMTGIIKVDFIKVFSGSGGVFCISQNQFFKIKNSSLRYKVRK